MKLSNMAVAVGIALGSASAFAGGGAIDLSSGSAGFSNTPTAGGFMDAFTFTALAPFTFSASITTIVNGAQNIDFSSITLTGPSGLFSFNQLLGNPVEVWSLSTGPLSAGSYAITLLGVNSPSIASYGGNVAVTVVPEPETYALMFAGLGVVGFLATRRNRRV